MEELLRTNCANCLKRFTTDEDKVERIVYLKTNRKGKGQEDDDVGGQGNTGAKDGQGAVAEDNGGSSSSVSKSLQDTGDGNNVELSTAVKQEHHEVSVGVMDVDDDVTEEEVEISTIEIESDPVSIDSDKQPFLEVVSIEETKQDPRPPEAERTDGLAAGIKKVKEKEQERNSVSIPEALSVVLGIPEPYTDFSWGKDDPCALCHKCAEVVTLLYSALEEFKSLSAKGSYVTKGINRFKEKLSELNVLLRKPSKNSKPQRPNPANKRHASSSKKGKSSQIDDDASDVSSDAGSLSVDLMEASSHDADVLYEKPKKRTSGRPRVVKKPPPDYEPLVVSDEESHDEFEDDDEEDPNFNAEEELKGIQIKKEHDRLRELSDICANTTEYKEKDLTTDEHGKFICPDSECDRRFKGIRNLNKHVIVHKLKETACPTCSEEFESIDELYEHIKTAHTVKKKKPHASTSKRNNKGKPTTSKLKSAKTININCGTCGQEFSSAASLQQHHSMHHEPAICETCNKSFPSMAILIKHQGSVHTEKEIEFTCPECGETFPSLEPLTTHFRDIHDGEINLCENCGKSFISTFFLIKHLKETHLLNIEGIIIPDAGEEQQEETETKFKNEEEDPLLETGERKRITKNLPFQCPHCEKEYKRKKQLDIHLLFHNGEEPQHSCDYCTKRFFHLKSLKRHILLHTTKNPKVCENCDRVFPKEEALKKHRKICKKIKPEKVVKETMEYKCTDCDKSFTRKEYLRLHQRIHTGEKPFMCQACGKSFRDPRNLAQHLITHKSDRPFCCSVCGLTFKRAHHLHDHEGTHKEDVVRPFVCKLPNCGKAFKLKKHLISHELVHSGTKEHQCEQCGKAFNRKDNLRQHVNKVHGKEAFADLIRVSEEVHIAPETVTATQPVQIRVRPTLVPVTAITTNNADNTATITTIQIPTQVLQALPGAHFTYTAL